MIVDKNRCRVWKEFSFEAAHSLPDDRIGKPNERLHGHSYMARVYVEGEINSDTGMVAHMNAMEDAVRVVKFRFDHNNLNEVMEHTQPTMERIAELIAVMFPILGVVRVEVWRPTLACGAIWERLP